MKLLFDQNLSFKLCRLLADVFPESNQIRLIGMEEAEDRAICGICEGKRFHSRFAGRRFCGYSDPLWSAAEGHLAALRQSTNVRNRTASARSRGSDSCLCRR